MAHVVGVPRRDPCQKCQLPVFLAERLTVGKKVYHRTCLKCARCGSQLTPGSFYETEVDGEYCCETCPDEEDLSAGGDLAAGGALLRSSTQTDDASKTNTNTTSPTAALRQSKTVRSSIADRLAFFEQGKTGGEVSNTSAGNSLLLQKSVTDEEKSKSLQRMEGTTAETAVTAAAAAAAAPTPSYRMSSALSSFLNDTIDADEQNLASTSAKVEMETSDTENESDNDDGEEEEEEEDDSTSLEQSLPALPQTQPPSLVEMREKLDDQRVVPSKRFTATAQLQLATEETTTAEEETSKSHQPSQTSFLNLKTANIDNSLEEETNAIPADDTNSLDHPISEQQLAEKKKTEIKLNLKSDSTITLTASYHNDVNNQQQDSTNNNGQHIEQQHEVKIQNNESKENTPAVTSPQAQQRKQASLAINLDLSEPNDNVQDVTKDKIAVAAEQTATVDVKEIEKIRADFRQLDEESATDEEPEADMHMDTSTVATVEMRTKSLEVARSGTGLGQIEDAATTERLSVVRARLQQFEVIANKRNNNDHDNDNKDNNMENSAMDDTAEESNERENELSAYKFKSNVSTKAKLSALEVDTKNMTSDKQLNTETVVKDDVISDEINLKTNAIESIVMANLEDEAKLKAMEVDKTCIESKPSIDDVVTEVPSKAIKEIQDNTEETEIVTELNTANDNKQPIVTTTRIEETPNLQTTSTKVKVEVYPEDLNPFASDDDNDDNHEIVESEANKENIQRQQLNITPQPRASLKRTEKSATTPQTQQNLNPFDSSDDEIELEKTSTRNSSTAASTPSSTGGKIPPPRPPPPRISRNPFGDETDEDVNFSRRSSLTSSLTKKTPVPMPRTNISQSQTPTPEPTPRLSNKSAQQSNSTFALQNCSDYYGSANSLGSAHTPQHQQGLRRNSDARGSSNSLTSSAGGTVRSRKNRKAPAPPTPSVKELFPPCSEQNSSSSTTAAAAADSSKASTPNSSIMGTPKLGRKKRPAPAPPKPARLDPALLPALEHVASNGGGGGGGATHLSPPKNSLSYPLQCETSDSKLSDEEKALLEGKQSLDSNNFDETASRRHSRRLIPLDASLLADMDDGSTLNVLHDDDDDADVGGKSDDVKQQQQQQLRYRNEQEESNVVYRRVLMPLALDTPTCESNPLLDELHDRQLEKLKDNKEAKNRNRQSQISASSGTEDGEVTTPYNKSAHGKWKRRKGPAPALPIPPRKVLQMLPLQEIRHELEIIEVQQQGLEKQGVILEKMIRDRCEGQNGELLGAIESAECETDAGDGKNIGTAQPLQNVQNTKEVEDLILQLFELVNEKNELFRRQAELMYLRRQHRLEQEQADLEYEIRVLMAQPERNKTDTDKAREEALIARLVEVVQLRNEVIECLEMDRLREAEEDLSIKQRLELHTAQREGDTDSKKTSAKLSKKEKKKQKESKKLSKSKKIDADKDADESELSAEKQKLKKKKKKLFF